MRRRGRLAALAALAISVVTAAAFTSAAQGVHAEKGPKSGPSAAGCQLGDKGKIKHVIYLQFDNVHFLRDNPNVPSDLEQMPHLLNFLKDNGTFDTNDHTDFDLAHRRRDPELAHRPLSGPARAGRLELVRLLPAGRLGRLLVLVQVLDGLHGRRQPGEQPADAVGRHELQHGQQRPAVARRHAAPCATRRRRGFRTRAPAVTSAASGSRTSSSRTTPRSSSAAGPTIARRGAVGRRDEHQGRERRRPRGRADDRRSTTGRERARSRRSRPSAPPAPAARASTSRRRSRRRTRAAARSTVHTRPIRPAT